MARRKTYFESAISPLTGNVTAKYIIPCTLYDCHICSEDNVVSKIEPSYFSSNTAILELMRFGCKQPVSISTWIVDRMGFNSKMAGTSVPSAEPVMSPVWHSERDSADAGLGSCRVESGWEWCKVISPVHRKPFPGGKILRNSARMISSEGTMIYRDDFGCRLMCCFFQVLRWLSRMRCLSKRY